MRRIRNFGNRRRRKFCLDDEYLPSGLALNTSTTAFSTHNYNDDISFISIFSFYLYIEYTEK